MQQQRTLECRNKEQQKAETKNIRRQKQRTLEGRNKEHQKAEKQRDKWMGMGDLELSLSESKELNPFHQSQKATASMAVAKHCSNYRAETEAPMQAASKVQALDHECRQVVLHDKKLMVPRHACN